MYKKTLRSPIVRFGNKIKAADLIWKIFGKVSVYVDPFCGSLSVPLNAPYKLRRATINDKDALLANFWRALQKEPEAVAKWAEYPAMHIDLMARREWLRQQWPVAIQAMHIDPDWYDVRMAGWWCWMVSNAIDMGRMAYPTEKMTKNYNAAMKAAQGFVLDWENENIRSHFPDIEGQKKDRPHVSGSIGVMSKTRKVGSGQWPHAYGDKGVMANKSRNNLLEWMYELAARIEHYIVLCKEWHEIVSSRTVLNTVPSESSYSALFLDPPYDLGEDERESNLYSVDDTNIAAAVRQWLFTPQERDGIKPWYHPRLRIILCAYEGDHAPIPDSTVYQWEQPDGYYVQRTSLKSWDKREILICNPACVPVHDTEQQSLF